MKRKNDIRPTMRYALLLLLPGLAAIAGGFVFLNQTRDRLFVEQTATAYQAFLDETRTVRESWRATDNANGTAYVGQFLTQAAPDNTALAQFTQNPTLALSSTPYFVEIIARDVIRRATTTPQIYPPVISMWSRSEQSYAFMDVLREHGIDARLSFDSTGVEGINDAELAGFQAYTTTLRIGINTDTLDKNALTPVLEQVFMLVNDPDSQLDESIFHNLSVDMSFYDFDETPISRSKTIRTMFHMYQEAQAKGLTGDALIKALGGYIIFGE
jgi:hypothetical protein